MLIVFALKDQDPLEFESTAIPHVGDRVEGNLLKYLIMNRRGFQGKSHDFTYLGIDLGDHEFEVTKVIWSLDAYRERAYVSVRLRASGLSVTSQGKKQA